MKHKNLSDFLQAFQIMTQKHLPLIWRSLIIVFMMISSLYIDLPLKAAETPVAASGQEVMNLQLGAPFRDNAILQRDIKVPIWGWAKAGDLAVVKFAEQKVSATADEKGKWMVWLSPLKASFEPRDMTISVTTPYATRQTEVLKNILVGEVWLASGQSNMQWASAGRGCVVGKVLIPKIMSRVYKGEEKYPVIREFSITGLVAMPHPIEKADGIWKTGENFMGYSAIAFSFAHKLFQELKVPIGILNCSFSQTSIESWTPREGFRESKDEYNKKLYRKILETDPNTPEFKSAWEGFYQSLENQLEANNKNRGVKKMVTAPTPGNTRSNRDATWLYNGKFNPVVPYAIKGAIWNQGYANQHGGLTYYDNLHALIRGWRVVCDRPELPVYFHQFYTPGSGLTTPLIGGVAEMRHGTLMARDIPNTGMASQIDIGGTIHYWHKAVPGQRLALHALKNQYGQKKLVVDGPIFKNYTIKDNQLIVEFDHADGGLVVAEARTNAFGKDVSGEEVEDATGLANPRIIKHGEEQVKLVYLADADRVWHPAKIKIFGNKLTVTAEGVKNPRGISYATGGVAFLPSLYNKALLPASPFIYYDNKIVLAENWPDEKLKVFGKTIDPKLLGKLYEWRKMPILSTQFRDNAVLQAGKPLVFWGSTCQFGEWNDALPEENMVIHFEFNGIKKTIKVTPDMKEWRVVLPAMQASSNPHSLTVSATLDGELVHKREITGMVLGELFYVASLGGSLKLPKKKDSGQIVRSMHRKSRRAGHGSPSRYSVAVSRTPKNRYAAKWAEATRGLPAQLGHAIASKSGTPVGIITMSGHDAIELKNWVPHTALSQSPSWREDYRIVGAKYPDTPNYEKSVRSYIASWKSYWEEDITSMIATKALPEGWSGFGEMPALRSTGTSTACLNYNIMTHSFLPTSLRGVIFLAGPGSIKDAEGTNFSTEMSALANSWKQGFGVDKNDDVPFFYTIPSGAKVEKPTKIKGTASALEGGDWSAIEKLIETSK